jgi:hypothetical protein
MGQITIETLQTYPYFFGTIIGLFAFAVTFAFDREGRFNMIVGGLLHLPLFPFALIYNREYWSPVRLGGGLLGIEDALFAFLVGAAAWLFGTWRFRSRLELTYRWPLFLVRYGGMVLFTTSLIIFFWSSGLGIMTASVIAGVISVATILGLKRDLWPIALSGAAGFTLLYCGTFLLILRICPSFACQWNGQNLWGTLVLGLPLDEVAWSCSFGALWPSILAYAFKGRLKALDSEKLTFAKGHGGFGNGGRKARHQLYD